MKIVVTQDVGMTSLQKSDLNKLGEVIFYDTIASNQQEYINRIQGADIIYSEENYMHDCIYEMKNSLLTFPFVSFLKPVDVSILKSNKLLCAGAKGGNKYAVSERNMVATLQVSRKLKEIMKIENKDIGWNLLSSVSGLRGLSVLILGKGDIGSLTGKYCEIMGASVDYYLRGDELKQKIQEKNIIINCLAFNEQTIGIINKDSLNGFCGAYITCTKSLIHIQEDIIELIKTGKITGYADDCAGIPGGGASSSYYQDLLIQLDGYNIFITPHIARATQNAIEYSNQVCIENIKAYIEGNPINLLY